MLCKCGHLYGVRVVRHEYAAKRRMNVVSALFERFEALSNSFVNLKPITILRTGECLQRTLHRPTDGQTDTLKSN